VGGTGFTAGAALGGANIDFKQDSHLGLRAHAASRPIRKQSRQRSSNVFGSVNEYAVSRQVTAAIAGATPKIVW